MMGIFIRWLILTAAIVAASYLIDGIRISGFFSAFCAAAVLGILNALFRPILFILTLPINILTRPKNTRNKLLNVLYNAHGKNRCS